MASFNRSSVSLIIISKLLWSSIINLIGKSIFRLGINHSTCILLEWSPLIKVINLKNVYYIFSALYICLILNQYCSMHLTYLLSYIFSIVMPGIHILYILSINTAFIFMHKSELIILIILIWVRGYLLYIGIILIYFSIGLLTMYLWNC